jgi:hypothetical protein
MNERHEETRIYQELSTGMLFAHPARVTKTFPCPSGEMRGSMGIA